MTMRKKLAFTVIAILLMAGCGQRGPLYLPEPATTNQPAEPSTTDVNNEQGV
ncbi:lipoprotein [Glaciecola sp. SC05]|uniref:LPS translocon maturation chaperone LptM n=1 Tax=Glaciecola sp. SC05 TaxID=1987355 RepID=UPI003527CF38